MRLCLVLSCLHHGICSSGKIEQNNYSRIRGDDNAGAGPRLPGGISFMGTYPLTRTAPVLVLLFASDQASI